MLVERVGNVPSAVQRVGREGGMLNGELCANERKLPITECSFWRDGKLKGAWSCWVSRLRVGASLCVMGKGALGCLLLSPWWGSCIIGMMREGIVLAM
jgi:hypothetical protein